MDINTEERKKEKETDIESERKKDCSICLKPIGDVDCFITKCSHTFHGSCVLNWLKFQRDHHKEEHCPLCRGSLNCLPDFSLATKKILYDCTRIMGSHNVDMNMNGTLEENMLWMRLPSGCKDEIIESVTQNIMGLVNKKKTQIPYNFSFSDLELDF